MLVQLYLSKKLVTINTLFTIELVTKSNKLQLIIQVFSQRLSGLG